MTAALLAEPSPRVALTAFGRLADRWSLSPAERATLLGRSGRTAYRYERPGRRLAPEVRERISLLVGIYEDVRALFGAGELADGWIRRANADFGGNAPLDRMLAGRIADLVAVRRYLAVARHGVAPGAA